MTRIRRTATIVLTALLVVPCTSPAFAAEGLGTSVSSTRARLTLNGHPLQTIGMQDLDGIVALTTAPSAPIVSNGFTQYRYGRGRRDRRSAAVTAITLGAVGAITGSAVLVYANRPDCSVNPTLGGCGYGTKVVGGAVLTAGIVGIVAGALLWE